MVRTRHVTGKSFILTQKQLETRLFGIQDTQFVGLTTLTVPDMRKRGNPFHDSVLKISTVNGVINSKYTRVVNRQRVRESKAANFRALERQWGTRIKSTPLVSHCTADGTTLLYLEVKLERRSWEFVDSETGAIIPEENLQPFLTPRRKSARQDLNREVVLRDYRLDHIAIVRIGGDVWRNRKCWEQLLRLRNSLFAGEREGVSPSPPLSVPIGVETRRLAPCGSGKNQ